MDSYRVEKQAAREDPAAGRGRGDRAGADHGRRSTSPSRSWIGCRTSSRPSTTSSATSRGPTPTGSHKLITEDIPNRVAADKAYQNAKKNSDKQNARIEHDKALARVMTARAEGRHGAVQAVHRQRVVQAVADRHGLRHHVRGRRAAVGPLGDESTRTMNQEQKAAFRPHAHVRARRFQAAFRRRRDATIASTAAALCSGARWAYLNVIAIDLCPSSSRTVLRSTPAITSLLANV